MSSFLLEVQLKKIMVICGAGASSAFLCLALNRMAQQESLDLNFQPTSIENPSTSGAVLIALASHVATAANLEALQKLTSALVVIMPKTFAACLGRKMQ
jgi:cellobiose-specific phosphotransferase system component IIB